jgi:hypothetical protein
MINDLKGAVWDKLIERGIMTVREDLEGSKLIIQVDFLSLKPMP